MHRYYLLILSLVFVSLAAKAEERLFVPDNLFYYSPAASVYGPEAAWNNPAALARYKPATFQVMADYFDGKYLKSWGTVVSKEGFATAYRKIDNPTGEDIKEYLWAMGLSLGGSLSVGGSYRNFSSGPEIYNNRHLWNTGLIFQSGPNLTVGATFSNLNKGKIAGERTQIEQQYSLAYRPFEEMVTLSASMFLGTKQSVSDASYVYHAEVRPMGGIYLSGFIDSDRNYQLGIRINLRNYFVGSQSRLNRSNDGRGTTTYAGVTAAKQKSIIPYEKRRVVMSISDGVKENPPQPIFGKKEIPYPTMLLSLYRAASDVSVNGLVINLDELRIGFAQAQELRDAIRYVRSAGKKVIVHAGYPNNIAYYVATAADSIYLPPVSQLNLVGLRAELTFYAGTLEKLGIKADLLRIGDYKTATEPFTNEASSDANREQINRLLDNLFAQIVTAIAEGRGLSADSVKALIENGPFNSQQAVQAGLVDRLLYRTDMLDSVSRSTKLTSLRAYVSDTLITDRWAPKPVIAIVVAEGDIGGTQKDAVPFQPDVAVTPGAMGYAFHDAMSNRQVKGILFRINSPGGLALAGEDIWHQAKRSANKKPIIVSMGNVAASGGYYIAMASPTVIANPGTITGSIGIFGGKVDLSKLYEKIDLHKELYQRGRFSAMLSSMRSFTDEERAKYLSGLNDFYQHFITLVAENRKLTVDSIDNLSRGRVWTGSEAISNGLVDGLGGLKEAIDLLKTRLGDDKEYGIELYPRNRPWLQLPMPSLFSSISEKIFGKSSNTSASSLISSENGVMFTRMPYDLSIE